MVDAVTSYKPNLRKLQSLESRLSETKDKQGFMGKAWNGFKEAFNIGKSEKSCEKMLDKYKSGRISFEEALEYINDFEQKQSDSTKLISNIATGVGSITAATLTLGAGPIGWAAAAAVGAPVGAAVKAGINTLDRATNNIDGDALDAKKIAKDAISGAITGTTSALSSGVGAGIRAGKFGLTVRNGVKCSAECGALAGSLGYLTDVAFGDKDFSLGDMVKDTAISSATSATVGAAVAGGMYGLSTMAGTVGKEVTKTTAQTIIQDSTSSSARKILNQAQRNLTGVAIGAIAANTTNKS